MNYPKEIKVGDLVKYSYDPASHMIYLVGATVEDDERQKYATLIGWDRDDGEFGIAGDTDGNQWFKVQWLELVKSASR